MTKKTKKTTKSIEVSPKETAATSSGEIITVGQILLDIRNALVQVCANSLNINKAFQELENRLENTNKKLEDICYKYAGKACATQMKEASVLPSTIGELPTSFNPPKLEVVRTSDPLDAI